METLLNGLTLLSPISVSLVAFAGVCVSVCVQSSDITLEINKDMKESPVSWDGENAMKPDPGRLEVSLRDITIHDIINSPATEPTLSDQTACRLV